MNCSKVKKNLIFYDEGKLNSSLHEQISMHLEGCELCSHLYEELRSTLEITDKRKPLKPNPYLYTRIKEKLDAREQSAINPVYQKVLRPAILTLVLLLGIYGGNRLGNFYESNTVQSYTTPTTEYYINDMNQEILEVLLLNN